MAYSVTLCLKGLAAGWPKAPQHPIPKMPAEVTTRPSPPSKAAASHSATISATNVAIIVPIPRTSRVYDEKIDERSLKRQVRFALRCVLVELEFDGKNCILHKKAFMLDQKTNINNKFDN